MGARPSRRDFLKSSVALGAGLVIGLNVDGLMAASGEPGFIANPFVKILPNGTTVVIAKHFEMGQGTTTGLATLVAEELDADWEKVSVNWAPADAKIYANLAFGSQGTGGSTAIANSFMQYREAGAIARDLLVRAAAAKWNVSASEITVTESMLKHASGRTLSFGDVVADAATLKPIEKPKLKDAKDFKLIGKADLRRNDSRAKTDGTAKFALDLKIPGMVYVVIARSPRFGGKVKSFKADAAMKVNHVVDVKQIDRGVAVYAKNTWAAIKGRNALEIEWDFSAAEMRSSEAMFDEYREAVKAPGQVARKDGDADKGLADAAKTVSGEFLFPFLAHAPMEPLNCIIRYDEKGAEIWDGCQFPSIAQPTAAAVLGLKPEQVTIHTVYAGGSFGRRATPTSDYVAEAAMAAKAIDGKWPVKVIWTREDDIRGGYYRPMFLEKVEAGVDKDGGIHAWRHRLAGKSILKGTPFEAALVKDGIDSTSVEGASTLPYTVPNITVDLHDMETPISVLWWRSVGHTHTAYSTEVIMDMLAEAAGADPVDFRIKALAKHPRHLGVLKLAAEKAGWGKPLPKGRARGVAVHESFASFVAQVAEVSVNDDGAIKVEKVVCAVDCGLVVNPDVVKAQMEGGIGYGLGAAMRNKISFEDGEVVEENFPDYEPLRLSDMPEVEVHMVASPEKPTGVGEPGVPPIAPAVANAIFAATGKRIFTLPFTDSGIEFV